MASKNFHSLAVGIFNKTLRGIDRSPLLNLEEIFQDYFEKEIESENELIEVKKFIFGYCEPIRLQRLPVPLFQSTNSEKLLITWFHSNYESYSNIPAPQDSFFEILRWINDCDGNEFLLACAAFLASLNCSKIFITDKPDDGGIDLIALNNILDQLPTFFMVQAKSKKNSKLSRELLLQEIGKFHNLPQKEVYRSYLDKISRDSNGCTHAHLFITNNEIKDDTKKEAFFSKSIIINDLRLAHSLSKIYSLDQIKNVGEKIKLERNSTKYEFDLQYNIANKFVENVNATGNE